MDDILGKLKEKELDILKETVKVCDKLGLKYSLFYGTLIGVVRHQGFIPWDDDIDIIMPREDYNIFVKEAQKYLPSNLFVQHYSTEKNNNNFFVKIRDRKTLFLERNSQEFDICHGIFIDIFPFDRCNPKKEKIEYKKRFFFNMITDCYSMENIKTIQNNIKRMIAKIVHYTYCKLVKINVHMEKEDLRRKKVNRKGGDCYILNDYSYAGTATYDELFDVISMKFENQEFCCSKAYDSVLTKLYGSYMIIPPENEQITHKPQYIKV